MSISGLWAWRPLGGPGGRHLERGVEYVPGWDDHLLASYGAQPDAARIAYYRLWDLGP